MLKRISYRVHVSTATACLIGVLAISARSAVAGDLSSAIAASMAGAPAEAQPDATDQPSDEAVALAAEFAAQFGAPTSKHFKTLSAKDREAFYRYFLHGRGAVPRDGVADTAVGIGNGTTDPGSSGDPSSPILLYGDPVPGYPGCFNIALANTGSGYLEYFALQVPHHVPTGATPLLVAFHQYGVSHGDVIFHTDFCDEVRARNWFMVAPLGATQTNFGSLPSQVNVQAVLSWARNTLNISATRIYGVGFSMGGGACASYAARHLDPAGTRFAAIINHTGNVSLIHAHANESGSIQQLMESWFGGSPALQPFNYRRCSTIDIDPITEQVGVGTDMGRNLRFVHSWLADQDPQPYLPLQTQLFQTHMHALNAANVLTTAPGTAHNWDVLDEHAACDWLAQYAIQEQLIGNTLADQNGAWHRFVVQQTAPGAFTPFSWFSAPAANRLSFWNTANLDRISVDNVPLQLVYSGALKLNLSSADGTGDQVIFLHVPYAPLSVTRNGVANATCVYNAQAQTLLVDELSSAGAQWVFNF